jgi:hypothetical protein
MAGGWRQHQQRLAAAGGRAAGEVSGWCCVGLYPGVLWFNGFVCVVCSKHIGYVGCSWWCIGGLDMYSCVVATSCSLPGLLLAL